MISFTEMQTGKATPFRMTFPALFLFLNIAAVFCQTKILACTNLNSLLTYLFDEFVSESTDIDYFSAWYALIQ